MCRWSRTQSALKARRQVGGGLRDDRPIHDQCFHRCAGFVQQAQRNLSKVEIGRQLRHLSCEHQKVAFDRHVIGLRQQPISSCGQLNDIALQGLRCHNRSAFKLDTPAQIQALGDGLAVVSKPQPHGTIVKPHGFWHGCRHGLFGVYEHRLSRREAFEGNLNIIDPRCHPQVRLWSLLRNMLFRDPGVTEHPV